jgi:hypothetical protein
MADNPDKAQQKSTGTAIGIAIGAAVGTSLVKKRDS